MLVRCGAVALVLCMILVGCDDRRVSGRDGGTLRNDSGSSGVDSGGPAGCVSTRVCGDRLDCEDAERCNTALTEPVCQRIRCGAEGSACSEDDLCAAGLECLTGVCTPTYDAVAACMTYCVRCPGESRCSDGCADAQAEYLALRDDAEVRGCLAEFNALIECEDASTACDLSECITEGEAWSDCWSG